MKVIVSKDISGVVIWKEGTKLELTSMNLNTDFWSKIKLPAKNPIWTSNGFFKVLFSSKKVAKYFPKLGEKLKNNDIVEANLNITIKKS